MLALGHLSKSLYRFCSKLIDSLTLREIPIRKMINRGYDATNWHGTTEDEGEASL